MSSQRSVGIKKAPREKVACDFSSSLHYVGIGVILGMLLQIVYSIPHIRGDKEISYISPQVSAKSLPGVVSG